MTNNEEETKKQLIQQFWQHSSTVDSNIIGNVETIGNGHVVVSIKVKQQHLNGYGKLHGGIICTIVDLIGTFAILSSQNFDSLEPGVSTDLNVSFMNGADLGDELRVESTVLKQGRTLAFAQVDIRDKSSGKLIAQGRHTKAIIRPTTATKRDMKDLLRVGSKL